MCLPEIPQSLSHSSLNQAWCSIEEGRLEKGMCCQLCIKKALPSYSSTNEQLVAPLAKIFFIRAKSVRPEEKKLGAMEAGRKRCAVTEAACMRAWMREGRKLCAGRALGFILSAC